MAHLTAVNHSIAELRAIIGRMADAGIVNMLALRGDPPGDPNGEWVAHPDGLNYADELVEPARRARRLLRRRRGVPVQAPALGLDGGRHRASSSRKCAAGADYAITQMFFDVDDYLRLRDRVSAAGCDVPIIAGLMPVTTMRTIERCELLSGAPFPAALGERFAAVADDPAAVRALGIEQASLLARRLLDEGAPGLHFITFNFAKATREVMANLARSAPRPAERRSAS